MAIATILLAMLGGLPALVHPAAPFPRIITDARTVWDVAPGIAYADYEMRTVDGPISLHVISADVHNPEVHLRTVLANDRLVSPGETVSSMAKRTGTVAGINGDYFDINQTNQPLNILVSGSQLLHMPMHRWALAFGENGDPQFAEFSVAADVAMPAGTIPLSTINDWPVGAGGAVLMTPAYGPLHPLDDVTELQLQPASGLPPFASYRVSGFADNTQMQPPGYYLAIGSENPGREMLPGAGDSLVVNANATPSLEGVTGAIGGGPLLVKDGRWYADPDGPSKGEFATHMPATAAGITGDGTLLLFEIDGRQPDLSVGVLQPQLAAIMIAFGVVTGMQFDGGGSSTMVARLPGEAAATVTNSPSDGIERRVGDALLIESTAPDGPAARLVSMPQVIRAMPGARVPIQIAVTDSAGHPADCTCKFVYRVTPSGAGRFDGGGFIAGNSARDATLTVDGGTLHARIPVHIVPSPAYVRILPDHPALRPGESLALQARAFDGSGYPIALPLQLRWQARGGRIDDNGTFVASARDALVQLDVGSLRVAQTITVGEHALPLPLARYARFATAPRNAPGSIERDAQCGDCFTLAYDFSGVERAAYANATLALPQRVLAISADVNGDGQGEILRLAVDNAIDERFMYTFARVDWRGWRRVEVRIPAALPQPITFKSIYVIDRVGPMPRVQAAGSIEVRDVRVILAGSSQTSSK